MVVLVHGRPINHMETGQEGREKLEANLHAARGHGRMVSEAGGARVSNLSG
jgi:hypothetical protein